MKILAIDYGRKRLGLATSSPLKIAHPAGTIQRKNIKQDMQALGDFIDKHEIEKILVGHPKNMDNTIGEMAKEAEQFAQQLEKKFSLPTAMWDERLTSWQAEQDMLQAGLTRKKRKKSRDQVAAALILQNYLDSEE